MRRFVILIACLLGVLILIATPAAAYNKRIVVLTCYYPPGVSSHNWVQRVFRVGAEEVISGSDGKMMDGIWLIKDVKIKGYGAYVVAERPDNSDIFLELHFSHGWLCTISRYTDND